MPFALKVGFSLLILVAGGVALLGLWIPPKTNPISMKSNDPDKPTTSQVIQNSPGGIQAGHGIAISGGINQVGGSGNTQIINADESAFRPLSSVAKSKMLSYLQKTSSLAEGKAHVTFVPKMDNSVHIKIAQELALVVKESGIEADVDENMLSYEPVEWGLVIHTHSGTVPFLPAFAEALAVFFPDMKFQCNTNATYPLGKIRVNLLGTPAFNSDGTVKFR